MKQRVLLVDDDLHMRSFLDEALHFLEFEVVVAETVPTALARLDEARFDVVMTDHRMPETDGLDLVRALRGRGFPGRILVVSGVLSQAERRAYEALRVDGIAIKPLSLLDLNRLLRPLTVVRAGAA